MKTTIVVGIVLLAGYMLYSFKTDNKTELPNPNGVHFYNGNWNEALAEAKKQNKVIFLDVYAVWCGPCKKLKKTTFNNEEAGDFFNTNFINIAIDGETPEGQKLMAKYGVRGFPTLLIVDADSNLIARTTGFQSANRLINFGKKNLQ